jgi:putative peptidoglycan binding protein
MPRRRRGSKRIAVDADAERGLALRIFLHSPKDVVAGAVALAAIVAIIANALFMQAGRHPAPMFGSVTTLPAVASVPANPLPKPRPVEADVSLAEVRPADPKAADKTADSRTADSRTADPRTADPKTADPLANLVKTTGAVQATSANIPRPPMAVPVSSRVDSVPASGVGSRRVAAVQRVLTEYGYGQLKPTGVVGSDTQAAILKFEKARKLPVTGQVSDRLQRELAAMIGHPVE